MKTKIIKKTAFVSLLLLLVVISNGQYSVFFAIWLSTTMLLYAVRKFNRWKGFLMAFPVIIVGYYIGFDVTPLPFIIPVIIAIIFGLFASLPYVIDSFFVKKRSSFLSTLIFPCVAVLAEFTYHQFNQYGTWGHFAYTQQSQYVLLQSISVFGLGYITFLITWFASVSNWIYEQRKEWANVKKGFFIYGLVLGLTLIYGTYRVQFQKANSETIRIASISALDNLKTFDINLNGLKQKENDAEIKFRENAKKLNQNLFQRSIKEAKSGAKIVFWSEANGLILKEDENELYKTASQIALDQSIYLGIGVAVIDPTNNKPIENKFVLFDKTGKTAIDYWKNIAVPGSEAELANVKETGVLKTKTPYGTIASAICFDLDFPQYLKQAKGSDILLAPSNDWKEIDPIHTNMAKFRAIEQGFNLIRQTSFGLSIGSDYTGKIISEMDHFTDSGKVLITQLPTKGTRTIYSMIGDTFIVFCLLLFILITVILKRKKA